MASAHTTPHIVRQKPYAAMFALWKNSHLEIEASVKEIMEPVISVIQ
jgi:hypothetical protein